MLISNANGAATCYLHDGLHRVTDTQDSGAGVHYCKRFRYDKTNGALGSIPPGVTVNNTVGRLTEAETDNCSVSPPTEASMITDEWFSYDADGGLTDVYEYTPHSGGYYHSTAAYWANGAVQSLSIPNYTALSYGIDGEGRLSNVKQGTGKIVCDSSCSASSTSYNAASEPLVINIGGTGDSDAYTYDPASERMTSYEFTVGAAPKSISAALNWNPNGSLQQLTITDGFNSGGSQTCNFGTTTVAGYDDLGRLLSANCGSNWQQTFSYDPFGNITKTANGGISWACPVCYNSNNQYNQTLSASISYDLSGNLLNDTFNKYNWDAYGRMSGVVAATGSINCGTSGTCLTYDGLGRMVEKNIGGVYTEILYSPLGKTAIMNGQQTTSAYFPLPGGATYQESGAADRIFWHKDWLGTIRFASTLGRGTVFDRAFAPFGEMYDNFGVVNTSSLSFTGDTQDTIAGLFDTPTRELHPNQGRWISPDPAGLGTVDPTNPQSWNRYAYMNNNPLSGVDTSGMDGCDGGDPVTCDASFPGDSAPPGGSSSDASTSDSMGAGGGVDPLWNLAFAGGPSSGATGPISGQPASPSVSSAVTSLGGLNTATGQDSSDVVIGVNTNVLAALAPAMSRGADFMNIVTKDTLYAYGAAASVVAGPSVALGLRGLAYNGAARVTGWYLGLTGGTGVVLGKYDQFMNYIDVAKGIGGNALNVSPDVYSFFNSAGQWWTLNQSFLQASLFRGQQIYMASPVVGATGNYALEIQFLMSRGIGPQMWTMMTLPY